MIQDQNQTVPWLQGGQFAPSSSVQRPGAPVSQKNPGTGPQQPVIPISTGENPLMPPPEPLGLQASVTDVLHEGIGRFVLITAQLGTVQREFEGVITDVGRDFITLVNDRLGTLVILPTIFIQFGTVPVATPEEPTLEEVEPASEQIEQIGSRTQG